ncbi:MAG TPA: hypothetical protein PK218_04845 [Flavobacterium sp.]|jgi:hypothetical protein|uniref:hypothetical protein n=1 Tax=Flavobacterium sp. TaxID=239 RepID=UPI002CB43325|nr:hypothetical protein [Flavobacterium sp.]MCA0349749.1 hypothetical protein [Bacteroidota bacterium]HPW97867.1 hypothetical protein [Flavobacterium sp.]HQA74606.1 hypothetical protein [Flavobacterium sp.]
MKTNYLADKIVSKNLICILFGHHYVEIKKVNNHFKEFECSHCKLQATNDIKGKKTALTTELKDINKTLSYLHLKREFLSHFYFSRNKQ